MVDGISNHRSAHRTHTQSVSIIPQRSWGKNVSVVASKKEGAWHSQPVFIQFSFR